MSAILNLLNATKGCKFVGLVYESSIKMNKVGNPLYGMNVTKVVSTNVQFGYSYTNAVNNRLEKANEVANFKSGRLPWGKWVDGQTNRLIEHKGSLYVRFYAHKGCGENPTYFVNGVEATNEQIALIKQFSAEGKAKGNSWAQSAYGLDENQVEPKTIKLDSIKFLSINGVEARA